MFTRLVAWMRREGSALPVLLTGIVSTGCTIPMFVTLLWTSPRPGARGALLFVFMLEFIVILHAYLDYIDGRRRRQKNELAKKHLTDTVDGLIEPMLADIVVASGRSELKHDPISIAAAMIDIIDSHEQNLERGRHNPFRAILDGNLSLANEYLGDIDSHDDL